jgi:uncharacterized protein YcfJ
MKKLLIIGIICAFLLSCASAGDPGRYNTQRGALIGGAFGSILGLAIGNDAAGALLGGAGGALIGGLVGNAADQHYQAEREAAQTNKRVVYVDRSGYAVESIPSSSVRTNCKKVTTKEWDNGKLVLETTKEVCEGTKTERKY